MPPLLQVDAIEKQFPTRSGPLIVLRGASFTLDAGQAVAIMGPSGSGKSTLLNILGTIDTPTKGRLAIDGRDPFDLAERELALFRNQKIGFVFQEHHLLPQCSVLENVLLPTLASPANNDATDRATQLLERVGLSERLDHRPAELSGGERQRVAIARALINQPMLLLADEPTGNLDRTTADVVAALLDDMYEEEGATLVVVTHSPDLAGRFDQRYQMLDGALVTAKET